MIYEINDFKFRNNWVIDDCCVTLITNNLGIENFEVGYMFCDKNQEPLDEKIKIEKFLTDIMIKKLSFFNPSFKFINYGEDQLVFVLKNNGIPKYTALVNQPQKPLGMTKGDYENLLKLKINPKVITPLSYYFNNDYELYITPYVYQARCISVATTDWGLWIPEPFYHFKKFDEVEKVNINSAMIAVLLSTYNFEKREAIAGSRIDGGDFILYKNYKKEEIKKDDVINYIQLITARKIINIDFHEYLTMLKEELLGINKYDYVILDKQLKAPIDLETIQQGFDFGITLLNKKSKKIRIRK